MSKMVVTTQSPIPDVTLAEDLLALEDRSRYTRHNHDGGYTRELSAREHLEVWAQEAIGTRPRLWATDKLAEHLASLKDGARIALAKHLADCVAVNSSWGLCAALQDKRGDLITALAREGAMRKVLSVATRAVLNVPKGYTSLAETSARLQQEGRAQEWAEDCAHETLACLLESPNIDAGEWYYVSIQTPASYSATEWANAILVSLPRGIAKRIAREEGEATDTRVKRHKLACRIVALAERFGASRVNARIHVPPTIVSSRVEYGANAWGMASSLRSPTSRALRDGLLESIVSIRQTCTDKDGRPEDSALLACVGLLGYIKRLARGKGVALAGRYVLGYTREGQTQEESLANLAPSYHQETSEGYTRELALSELVAWGKRRNDSSRQKLAPITIRILACLIFAAVDGTTSREIASALGVGESIVRQVKARYFGEVKEAMEVAFTRTSSRMVG